ncbi:probable disease resistance protein At5g66900 isoform X2 [Rosa chinensis]|nr:probable disease resistance protein At5g66900 isoform X2 [Rosa chinensis]
MIVPIVVVTAAGGYGKTLLALTLSQDKEVRDTVRNNIIFISFPKKGNLQCIVQRLCKHKGSGHRKILVTSRFEIPRFGIPFHLYGLSEDEAMALLCHSAGLAYFDKEDRNKSRMREGMTEFTTEARQIVSHCSGSPLAITVVGKSLCGKPAHVWRRKAFELDYHNTILDTDITLLSCLQSTFEDMDKELQAAYLDLAVLPNKFLDCLGTAVDVWAELQSHLLDNVLFCTTTFHELSAWHLVFLQYSSDKRFFQNERIDDYWFRHVRLVQRVCLLPSQFGSNRRETEIDFRSIWKKYSQVVERTEGSAIEGAATVYLNR